MFWPSNCFSKIHQRLIILHASWDQIRIIILTLLFIMWIKWTQLDLITISRVYNAGDLGSIPGSGIFPEEGNDNPLQYSCLENPMDGGAWCRLLSMESQRVGHDWVTSLSCFPGGSDCKESTCNAGHLGSILGLGRSPGEG